MKIFVQNSLNYVQMNQIDHKPYGCMKPLSEVDVPIFSDCKLKIYVYLAENVAAKHIFLPFGSML